MLKDRIDTAACRIKADCVLRGGLVVNVFTGGIEQVDVAIKDGYIVGLGEYESDKVIDCTGKYIAPAFIDTHLHIESSMLSPTEFCKAAAAWGTTTIIADPHEIANVCGIKGVRYMIDQTKGLPMNVNIMLPSCVPATFFESSGAVIDAAATATAIGEDGIFGLGEFMNFPGVIGGDSECIGKLQAALDCGKIIDGHAPEVTGPALNAYITAGIKTEHECTTVEDMRNKIARGMYIQLRQGTATQNVAALVEGVTDNNFRRCIFCTDDRHADSLLYEGHLNAAVKTAVAAGLDPVRAITIATLNAAECYSLKGLGAVAPSYLADIVILEDLVSFRAEQVFHKGELIAANGKALFGAASRTDSAVLNTVNARKVNSGAFVIKSKSDRVRCIGIIKDNVVTDEVIVTVSRDSNGVIDVKSAGLNTIAVIERHKGIGNVGLGLVSGYGIKGGAIAQTVAHDSHNIIVIGDNNDDMATAVNALIDMGGGLVVVSGGSVIGNMPLEIAGLMTDKPIGEVVESLKRLMDKARALGISKDADPFMTLSFLALPVIPKLKVTDKGLFDVGRFDFVPIEAD